MRSSSACWLPFLAFKTSWRSSSSRWTFWAGFGAVAVRAAMPDYPHVDGAVRGSCEGRSCCPTCKSHLEVEGEPSTIRRALQDLCDKCKMLRTYVRPKRAAIRTTPAAPVCHDFPMGRTVLIVDDHPSFRASARAMLESEGFEVIGEAEDGAAAILAVEELQPDVVVLDVQLPDMTGFDVCEALE